MKTHPIFSKKPMNQEQFVELEIKLNSELEKQKTNTRAELFMFESKFAKIESHFAAARSERHDILLKYQTQRAEHNFLVEAFTRLEERVNSFETTVNQRFENIEKRMDHLEKRFDQLENLVLKVLKHVEPKA